MDFLIRQPREATILLGAFMGACAHNGHAGSGQSGTEGSEAVCTVEVSRHPLTAEDLVDVETPVFLVTLNGDAEQATFGWLDATGSRHITIAHVQVEIDLSAATDIEWRTASAGAAPPCPSTTEYEATLALETDDGALSQKIAGTISSNWGLIQFAASVPSSRFEGTFSPGSTNTVQAKAAWSGEDLGLPDSEPHVELRKLQLTDATGDVELAALAQAAEAEAEDSGTRDGGGTGLSSP